MEYRDPGHYLPHSGRMLLIDRVNEVTSSQCSCTVRLARDARCAMFLEDDGSMRSEVGIELICQCVGVFAEYHRERLQQDKIRLGMVLSCRSYEAKMPFFPRGAELEIRSEELMNNGGMGAFYGTVSLKGKVLASGQVSVYQPTDEELEGLFARKSS